jgi:hypothetical protein
MSMTASAPKRPLTWADLSDADMRRVSACFHEAGHAVAGVLHGGTLRSAGVYDGRVTGLQGLTKLTGLSAARETAMTLAGPWAEAGFTHRRRPGWRDIDAVLAGNGSFDADALFLAGADVSQLSLELGGLMERCWPAVVTLARRLHRDGEARHEHVLDALGLDGGTAHMGLSMIRSGSVPGSFTVTPADALAAV